MVWQHIVLMHVVPNAGRQMKQCREADELVPYTRNDVHKHDMLPHHFNEVFY
jgi:hypothetical protein